MCTLRYKIQKDVLNEVVLNGVQGFEPQTLSLRKRKKERQPSTHHTDASHRHSYYYYNPYNSIRKFNKINNITSDVSGRKAFI